MPTTAFLVLIKMGRANRIITIEQVQAFQLKSSLGLDQQILHGFDDQLYHCRCDLASAQNCIDILDFTESWMRQEQ